MEALVDKLSASLTGEELEVIERLYKQAMKLETEFFLAQPVTQKTVAPLLKYLNPEESRLVLFSDFDLTCTIVDSSAILAEIAIVTAQRLDQDHSENKNACMSSVDLRSTWGDLSKQYTEEYEQCIEDVLATDTGISIIICFWVLLRHLYFRLFNSAHFVRIILFLGRDFSYEDLLKALELLVDFEKKANARVIDSGVLKGINIEDIKKAAERIILQDGCTSFFQNIMQKENVNVHVLSYCWCGDLIRSKFAAGKPIFLSIFVSLGSFVFRSQDL